MWVPIRVKLVLLLTTVALLPLMAALVWVVWEGRQLRMESVGQEQMSVALAQASALNYSLKTNVEAILRSLQDDPDVVRKVSTMFPRRSQGEMAELDAVWAAEPFPTDHPVVAAVLHNDIADRLRSIMAGAAGIVEIFVTDCDGALVAASGQTSDFYQADEDWWKEAHAGGTGLVCVPPVSYDESARVWSVDLCIPLLHDGRVVGVAKAVLSVSDWIKTTGAPVGTQAVAGVLLNQSGEVIYPRTAPDAVAARPDWATAISKELVAGFRPPEEGVIRAYAPVSLPPMIRHLSVRTPEWMLVLQQSRTQAMAEVDRLMWTVIGGGMIVILVVFLGGLSIVDRSIGRRIRHLQSISRRMGQGDYSQRAEPRRRRPIFGTDEIDDLSASLNDTIDRVARSQEQLRESEAFLNATGRMAKVGGWELDPRTMAIRLTDEVYNIYRIPRDQELSFKDGLSFFHPADRPIIARAIQRASDYGEPYDLELRFTTAGGKEIWTHATCTPRRVNGKTVKLSGTFQDITDRKQVEEELARANELKTKFIKVAGHELRTPLSYILAMPKLMAGVTDPQKLQHAISSMEAKARRLNEVVQSMFKLMRGEDYSEYFNLCDVQLCDIFRTVYADCLPFVEEREQALVVGECEGIGTLRVDPEKVRDVIENLIGNAVKFTPVGGTIRVEADTPDDEHVRISIADEGPGISQTDLPNIFNPFYSTDDVMKHTSGSIGEMKHGMGLGLAVVKHFVDMHHGSVDVATSAKGSTFTVMLPVRPPGNERPEPRGAAPTGEPGLHDEDA